MKKLILLLAVVALASCKSNYSKTDTITLNYPKTKTVDTVDTYFGEQVKDPYRWLEDDRSPETEAWVKKQNKVTFDYLNQLPIRSKLENRLSEIWNYEKISAPFVEGDYTYFYKNSGLQNQSVLYRKKGDGDAEVFLDPNTFSEDGTISLGNLSFSKNGKILAYSISEGGSDWRKVMILDVENRTIVEDTLKDIKFSALSWYKNEGFTILVMISPKVVGYRQKLINIKCITIN